MARLILDGIPLSSGIAMGPVIIGGNDRLDEKRNITEDEIGAELAAITAASTKVYASLRKKLKEIPENLEDYRDMLETQMELSRDPKILDGARARVAMRKICAAWALNETLEELANLFKSLPEACARDRTEDILAIRECLLCALPDKSPYPVLNGILAVRELTPGDIINFQNTAIKAIITVEGGATTHALILARSYKLPVICGISGLFEQLHNGEMVIVDGFQGKLLLNPDSEEIEKYQQEKTRFSRLEEILSVKSRKTATTRDGKKITVMANMESPGQSRQLKICGAEGIGLYRTEFSYLNGELPDEESLYKEYKKILRNIGGKPVVFRTLDAGSDKVLPESLRLHEDNPALGLRGIRFCLHYREIFETQLRALLRACVNSKATLMLPMVTTLEEISETKAIIRELEKQLSRDMIPHAESLPVGIMLETPAAALIVDEVVKFCDFISIGTNDLLHYLLAIDRGNRHVAALHDPLHPAFLRLLASIMKEARKNCKPVSVCGELAADPYGIVLLIGLGVDILSATPRFVPSLKYLLSQINYEDCKVLVEEALNSFEPGRIQKKLKIMVDEIGLETSPALIENLAVSLL